MAAEGKNARYCRMCLVNKWIFIDVTATMICALIWIYQSAYMIHLEGKEEKKQFIIPWLISPQTGVATIV